VTAEAVTQRHAAFLTTFPAATVRALPDAVDRLAHGLGAKEVAKGAKLHVVEAESAKISASTTMARSRMPHRCAPTSTW
jgi:hypothetical protein